MNIGIDIDGTLLAYPEFFVKLGRLWKQSGCHVFIITGNDHSAAVEKLAKVVENHGDGFYDRLIDTSMYNQAECAMIGNVRDNEVIVGHFKQRMCLELDVAIMFDDQAILHRRYGNIPIFEVR